MNSFRIQRLRLHMVAFRGLLSSLVLALGILGLGGIGFWWLDPEVKTLDQGLWLAFTTAATVGYGDLVPSTTASRAFAVVVVLVGLAVLSLVTASVAAMLVETDERGMERALMQELQGLRQDMRHLRNEVRQLQGLPALPHDGTGH
jgi:voltage-gated potassium channel